jgi:dihydropyrimidinase
VTEAGCRRADILCRDGWIAAIGDGLAVSRDTEVIDAGGCFVMPGGIDPHTHMQLPMMDTVVADDFFTGTAAAAGGTTTILDFVGPADRQSPLDALAEWHARAAKAAVDFGFHMTVSW